MWLPIGPSSGIFSVCGFLFVQVQEYSQYVASYLSESKTRQCANQMRVLDNNHVPIRRVCQTASMHQSDPCVTTTMYQSDACVRQQPCTIQMRVLDSNHVSYICVCQITSMYRTYAWVRQHPRTNQMRVLDNTHVPIRRVGQTSPMYQSDVRQHRCTNQTRGLDNTLVPIRCAFAKTRQGVGLHRIVAQQMRVCVCVCVSASLGKSTRSEKYPITAIAIISQNH